MIQRYYFQQEVLVLAGRFAGEGKKNGIRLAFEFGTDGSEDLSMLNGGRGRWWYLRNRNGNERRVSL